MFEVEVSGIYVPRSDIKGATEIETALTYNEELGVYSFSSPKAIQIHGTGFNNLYNAFLNDFEQKFDIDIYKRIENSRTHVFNGKILLADCTFEPKFNMVEVPLVNLGFQEKIDGNFDVPVSMTAEQSKNSTAGEQISITPPTAISIAPFTFWTAPATTYVHNAGSVVKVYDLKDCFEQIVSYISDGTISFASDWYDGLASDQKISVTTGEMYRTGFGSAPIVSLRQLFLWCKSLENLVILFDTDSNGVKRFRLEREEYLEQNGLTLFITQPNELKINIDQSKLYNSVKVGSSEAFSTNGEISGNFQFPKIRGGSYGIEEFAVQGVSNIQQQRDLTVNDLIYDHNKLEDIAINNVTDNDKFIVFIQYTQTTNVPTPSDIYGIAPLTDASYFYNQRFLNSEILKRHTFFAPLVLNISNGSDTFFAQNTTLDYVNFYNLTYQETSPTVGIYNTNTFTSPLKFENDFGSVLHGGGSFTVQSYDTNNNFGNGTIQGNIVSQPNSLYICPVDGVYQFATKINVIITFYLSYYAFLRVRFKVTDGAGVLKATYESEYVCRRYTDGSTSGSGLYYYLKFYETGATYSDMFPLRDSSDGNVLGVSFDAVPVNNIYLDQNDKVYVELEVEELDSTTLWPNPEYAPTNTGIRYFDGSGTHFNLKPIHFACTKTTEGENLSIETKPPIGLYQAEFNTQLTEDQITDVLNTSNVSVALYGENIKTTGIVQSMQVTHKDNLANFVIGSRKIER